MPSVRRRFVGANDSSKCLKSIPPASAVAWWTIASGFVSSTTPAHRFAVENVQHGRLGAELAQRVSSFAGPGRADDLVPARDELRHERGAHSARCSDEQNLHLVLLSSHTP